MPNTLSDAIQRYPTDFPQIQRWLELCPTCWNAEYDDSMGMFCLYICPPEANSQEFLSLFSDRC